MNSLKLSLHLDKLKVCQTKKSSSVDCPYVEITAIIKIEYSILVLILNLNLD